MLVDNHGRKINYLRLAVTDRCNLRCFYCMPEKGIKYMKRKDLLTFEEMTRLVKIFSGLGVNKVRITGGEPFVRSGMMEFLEEISSIPDVEAINITTNGTFTQDFIPRLEKLGIKHINLSLDSLDKERFFDITRRDLFDDVMKTYHQLVDSNIQLKVNMVVMEGRNIEDIYPMIELTKNHDVSVRFIEEMPFNGSLGQGNKSFWSMKQILKHVSVKYEIDKLIDPPSSTSSNYQVKGYKGSFGIIAAFTRSFCGTCNRIRLTPQGTLKTCLYDNGGISFRDMLRNGATDAEVADQLKMVVGKKYKDGFEAEASRDNHPVSESMATIGG